MNEIWTQVLRIARQAWFSVDDEVSYVMYQGADKSLALSGRKQATTTKLDLLQTTQKKFRKFSVQPGLRGNNDLHVGRKMATFQLVFFQSGWAKDLSAPLYLGINLPHV